MNDLMLTDKVQPNHFPLNLRQFQKSLFLFAIKHLEILMRMG